MASKRHWKVEPDSLEEKVKVGVVSAVDPEGPELIVVWGAAVSTVKERETIVLSLPGRRSPSRRRCGRRW